MWPAVEENQLVGSQEQLPGRALKREGTIFAGNKKNRDTTGLLQ
jgi:hypothetical protein